MSETEPHNAHDALVELLNEQACKLVADLSETPDDWDEHMLEVARRAEELDDGDPYAHVRKTTAQVRVNRDYEWNLLIKGTDTYVSLYRERHPELEPFPGNAMGHRLIELGWMPDRSAATAPKGASIVEMLTLSMYAGWVPSRKTIDGEEWLWTIPVTRH